jgi:hypothetical protein
MSASELSSQRLDIAFAGHGVKTPFNLAGLSQNPVGWPAFLHRRQSPKRLQIPLSLAIL